MRRFFTITVVLIIAGLASLYALGAGFHKDTTLPPGFKGHLITLLDDTPIRFYSVGEGPNVLLIHGSLGSMEDWETLIPELRKQYTVTAFDRIGHGFSGLSSTDYSLQENARIVLALIQKLGLRDVIVVGHSYGAAVALTLAVENPDAINGYVLLAPVSAAHGDPTLLDKVIALPQFGLGLLRVLAPTVTQNRVLGGLKEAVSPNRNALPPDFIETRLTLWNHPAPLYARARQSATFRASIERIAKDYINIQKPVIILQGEQDFYQPQLRDAQNLSQQIPHARLLRLPDTGYYIQYQNPAAVHEAINNLAQMPTQRFPEHPACVLCRDPLASSHP